MEAGAEVMSGVGSFPGPEPAAPLTVVVAQFGQLISSGLSTLIDGEPSLQLLGMGLDLGQLEATVAAEQPDVVLLNDRQISDSALFRRLRAERPGVGLVVLAKSRSYARSVQLLAWGANACMMEDASEADVLAVIGIAAKGDRLLFSDDRGADLHEPLTSRQEEVLRQSTEAVMARRGSRCPGAPEEWTPDPPVPEYPPDPPGVPGWDPMPAPEPAFP